MANENQLFPFNDYYLRHFYSPKLIFTQLKGWNFIETSVTFYYCGWRLAFFFPLLVRFAKNKNWELKNKNMKFFLKISISGIQRKKKGKVTNFLYSVSVNSQKYRGMIQDFSFISSLYRFGWLFLWMIATQATLKNSLKKTLVEIAIFYLKICQVGELIIIHKRKWAKFGYRSDSKVDFFNNKLA